MTQKLPKGITQRGESFRVSIMVEGVRRTATCKTLEAAMKEAKRLRAGEGDMPPEKVAPWTYREAADRWVREVVQVESDSAGSIRTRTSAAEQVVKHFGASTLLNHTSPGDLSEWKREMKVERKLSPYYINLILSAWRSMNRHAFINGGRDDETPKAPPMKKQRGRIRFMSKDEERLALAWCEHHGEDALKAFLIIALDTGMRIGEVMALTYKDALGDRIHIWKSKSQAGVRAVPVTQRVHTLIRERRLASRGGEGVKILGGLSEVQMRVLWGRMRESLGLADDPQFVPHVTRHTCCTRLVSGGLDLRTVQLLMGHEKIETTMRYSQFVPEQMFKATSILEGSSEAPARPNLKIVEGT